MADTQVHAEISKCQIQFKLYNAPQLFKIFDGPSVTLDGVTFTPQVKPCENRKRRLTTLGFYLKCNWDKEILLKNCTVAMTFKLVRQAEDPQAMPYIKKSKCTYNSEIKDWGYAGFIDWSRLVEPCWMQDNSINLQVEFEITQIEKETQSLVETIKSAKITAGNDSAHLLSNMQTELKVLGSKFKELKDDNEILKETIEEVVRKTKILDEVMHSKLADEKLTQMEIKKEGEPSGDYEKSIYMHIKQGAEPIGGDEYSVVMDIKIEGGENGLNVNPKESNPSEDTCNKLQDSDEEFVVVDN